MIKPIKRPDWFEGPVYRKNGKPYCLDTFWNNAIEPLNQAIEKGVEVTGSADDDGWFFSEYNNRKTDTHRAILIGIEPIKKETLENVVKDWLEFEEGEIRENGPYVSDTLPKLIERAKRVLKESDKDD